ncbi:MAG TPA: LysR substrate-binding domain-containing protein [Gemmatimonadales bacterium]|nr:LysR substrate-binding domain-containing protein [Gemmatimonadales bacterium]
MELRHLRYFQAVASEGGFGRAALALRVAQPALSRQIRALEHELDTALLIRSPKGVSLTLTGDVALEGSARVLRSFSRAIEQARLAGHGRSGRCRIGVGKPVLWSGLIARVIGQLSESHRDIELEIVEMEGPEQWRRLNAGQLDLGVTLLPPSSMTALTSEPILDSTIDSVLVAVDHPLAGRRSVAGSSLNQTPLIGFAPSIHPEFMSHLMDQLARAGIQPEARLNYPSMQSVWTLVAAGRGWTLTSSKWGRRAPEGTVRIPVRDLGIPFHLSLVSRRDEERSHVLTVMEAFRATRANAGPDLESPRWEESPTRRSRKVAADRGVELRHLRYFVQLVDEGGFGRAAKQLKMTQPGLSRQIRDLEVVVGTPLVKRIPRGVRVTAAGETLRSEANQVERGINQLLADIRAAGRGMHHQCVIGSVTTTITARAIARAFRLLESSGERLEPAVVDVATPQQPEELRRGRIDIGIGHVYPELSLAPELCHERLMDDWIECALVGTSHPLATRRVLTQKDLAPVPFLFMPRDFHPAFYDSVFATLQRIGIRPRVEREYSGLHTVWSIAGRGDGWALGFRSHRRDPPDNLVAIPVKDLSLPWGLDMLWRNEDANPCVATVVAALRQVGVDFRHPERDGKT